MKRCVACACELTLFGPYKTYTYCHCANCGSIQLCPMPGETEMEELYAAEYVAAEQTKEFADPERWRKVSRTYCQSLADAVKAHVPSGVVIDYGAGWGFLLEMLVDRGYQACGLEISRAELAYARAQGLPIKEGDFSVVSELKGNVDAIVMLAVFEHLVNHGKVLSAANELLKSGGVFATLHPTAAAYNLIGRVVRLGNKHKPLPDLAGAFSAPWHTVLFSVKATEQIVSRYGFRLLEVRPAPQGRLSGMLGLVQRILEFINKVGWRLFGTRWPLVTTHIFVFEKI
jgi:SAM-dependent methyltransferase